jgi:His/Glu/Gln/Arg/opine family amino acid ABC transporter permease subunit
MNTFVNVTLNLLSGFGTTCLLFLVTLVLSLPLGLIISFGSMSRFAVLRWPVRTIVWIIRGTPLMLQLVIVFFGPGLIFHQALFGVFRRRLSPLSSTTPAIFPKYTEAAYRPSHADNTRPDRCWV